MRDHDVRSLTASELERAKRELAVSLALARPGSPVCVPITARMLAIDTEIAVRAHYVIRVCGCGMGTDNDARMDGHLWSNPGHQERDLSPYQDDNIAIVAYRP